MAALVLCGFGFVVCAVLAVAALVERWIEDHRG